MTSKLFAKGELPLLWPFYLERFISHLVYFAPAFFVIFFNQTLSLTQISILFSVLAISTFIFEIPTGAFADLFGRKTSTLFAYLLMALLLPMYIIITNFYSLILLFALWGLFGTFYSGAREAWVIDNIKYHKRNDLINNYYLKEYSIIMLGMFLSGFLGSFIVAKFGINSIWIFASLSWALSFLLIFPVKEHKLTKEKKTTFKKMYKQSKDSIGYSLKHHVLLFLFMATFFVVVREAFGGDIIWQPFLQELGFPIYAFGFLFSISMLLGVIAPLFAKPLLKILKNERNYLIFLMAIGMLLNFSIIFATNYITGAILVLGILFLVSMAMPIEGSFTQKFIPSKKRATILSFKSMIISLAYAISAPIAGIIADTIGTQKTMALGGIFLIPAIFFYLKINEKKKVK